MKRIQNFDEFIGEAVDMTFFTSVPILAKAITDKFTLSIAKDILSLINSDPDNPASWQEPYRQIFRKACMQFGGADKADINKTCNKPATLQKLAEHYFDPNKGIFNQKEVSKWVDEVAGEFDPNDPNSQNLQWEFTTEDIDDMSLMFADILLKTGIPAGDLKKTGTYILEKAIPVMKSFYKTEDLANMQIMTDGKLIDAAKAKGLLEGGAEVGPGGQISLN